MRGLLETAALDQNAETRRARNARYERDWRCENEGTWGRGHEHGESAHGVTRLGPGCPGEQKCDGSKITAYRSATRMKGAFAVCAADTRRTMPEYVLSPARAVALSSKVAPAFTVPLSAVSPRALVTGMASPVSAPSSSVAEGDRIEPSTGTTSPARTSMMSSIATASTGTSSTDEPVRR